MSLSKHIIEFRKENKISQTALATHLGITQKTLSHIETGKIPVSTKILERLVKDEIVPLKATDVSKQLKDTIDRMECEDQLFMYDIAKRLMR